MRRQRDDSLVSGGAVRRENFPVALRVLPARFREPLLRIYDVARVIDDLGDEADGDRTAALLAFRADLERVWAGQTPDARVLLPMTGVVRSLRLSRQPLLDLVEANLRDQTHPVYETYAELLGYCELSANPIGRLVLEVFGAGTPARVALSDRICTALQIIEHCQDVAEDHRAGRCYLPAEDLRTFGVRARDFGAARASEGVRALVRFEVQRAEALLGAGTPLTAGLSGWARLAVAGYVAGGRAAVAALRRAGWAVLPEPPRTKRGVVARELARELARKPTARRKVAAGGDATPVRRGEKE